MLTTVCCDRIIIVWHYRVLVQILEFKSEVIIETVTGNAALTAVGALVHFECTGHVLTVAYHDYRDVADKDSAHDRFLLLFM